MKNTLIILVVVLLVIISCVPIKSVVADDGRLKIYVSEEIQEGWNTTTKFYAIEDTANNVLCYSVLSGKGVSIHCIKK